MEQTNLERALIAIDSKQFEAGIRFLLLHIQAQDERIRILEECNKELRHEFDDHKENCFTDGLAI